MYATPEQLLARFDSRIIGELIEDNNTVVSESGAVDHPLVLEALEDASGQIRSAAMVGDKYTAKQLDDLSKDNDPFLVRLTCDLALGFLYQRRQSSQEYPANVVRAEEWLATLRFGERIFNVSAAKAAGNVTNGYITDVARSNLQLRADNSRYFPRRVSRSTRDG